MMNQYTREDIIRLVEEEDVEFIRLQFVDIYGNLKNMAVTTSQLEKVLNNQCTFDGAAIEGFADPKKYQLFLAPDLDTFTIFPWRPQQGKVARFICDVKKADGTPFKCDSRYILKKVMKEAEEMGYTFNVGPECEFFLFDMDENGEPTTSTQEKGGYFDVGPLDLGENARREIVLFLEDMGFEIENSFHAGEIAQHEVDFKYDNALCTADNIMTFKMVVRTVAKRHGFHGTFMPKPSVNLHGSGMHLSMSLMKDGKNVFSDENAENGISELAYQFMAGILEHVEGLTLLANPIINSYKRLVPGYRAPVSVDWSETDRDALVRLTSVGGDGALVELRSPDGAANPYLLLAACLACGLEGIKKQLKPQKEGASTKKLPTSLESAILEFEKDSFIQEVLGKHICTRVLEAKKEEWNEYCHQVSQWEKDRYLLLV